VSSFSYQPNPIPITIKLPNSTTLVRADGFGNIYLIDKTQIFKYSSDGKLQKTFSTKRFGDVTELDATNPLKLLVYYRDFQQILFLDNQLTESNSAISLEKIDYEQTSLVCASANNGFWIYNKQNNELVRFDSELNPLIKTGNLKRILDINLKPNFIKEYNGYLYLNCPNEGILLFDIYGTYYKTIPIKNLKEFTINNTNIYYFENGKLKEYQTQSFNIMEINYNDTLLKTVMYQNNRYYKIYSDSLKIH